MDDFENEVRYDNEKREKAIMNIPLFYSNGVVVAMSLTDLHLTANVNSKPVCVMVIPLPAAKSLVKSLNEAINDFESKTNTEVLDLSELSSLLTKR